MKNTFKIAALLLGVIAFAFSSCNNEPKGTFELTGGVPTIKYIRLQDAAVKDSMVTSAYVQTGLTIVGENLTSIREMYFNDQKAVLNTSYITNYTMLVSVPRGIPGVVSDKIYMITRDGDTCTYDFHVSVPGPVVNSMKNEWVKEGAVATVTGNYFINDPNEPLTITFVGEDGSQEVAVTSIKTISQSELTFVVPAGAPVGQIRVHTIYGEGLSKFYYHDKRGLITDFDGTTPIVPQGWNIAATYSEENGVDGNYVEMTGSLTEDGGWVESVKLPFWCGNWNGDPMSIQDGAGVPLRNWFANAYDEPHYFANPDELEFKFELFIPKSNPWSAASMQILFINNQLCANDAWQNNTYIQTSADGGKDLCRALYRPWATTGSFDTADEWITVTIPLSDFLYNRDGTPGSLKLSEESFDSFVMWPDAGGVSGTPCTPIFRYDNLRVVKKL